ncbi:hypothetical protein RRG08_062886 [Elysia crispata]|uniref:Uncharacterized protein n=1 Tax=Elysia crispata TaxID=231223 RepID=A0AAE1E902_9GAST|nr:hypothetical protein RRG08_062886 [Elysia crispata]
MSTHEKRSSRVDSGRAILVGLGQLLIMLGQKIFFSLRLSPGRDFPGGRIERRSSSDSCSSAPLVWDDRRPSPAAFPEGRPDGRPDPGLLPERLPGAVLAAVLMIAGALSADVWDQDADTPSDGPPRDCPGRRLHAPV